MPSSRRGRRGGAPRGRRPPPQSEASTGWSSLPPELVALVVEKLHSSIDYVRFRCVCSGWRSAVPRLKFPPLLLLFGTDDIFFRLYDPTYRKVLSFPFPEEARQMACLGSSHGWLFLIDESGSISLVNPFTQAQYRVPRASRQLAHASRKDVIKDDRDRWLLRSWKPEGWRRRTETKEPIKLSDMRSTFIAEAILSSSPDSPDEHCLIVAVLAESESVAFCRLGDKEWRLRDTGLGTVESVAYGGGRLYAMDKGCRQFAVFEVDSGTRLEFIRTAQLPVRCDRFRLLASGAGEDLLLVAYLEELRRCKVYKSGAKEKMQWSKVESIGDKSVFMSKHFKANTVVGEFCGCRGNTIWFPGRRYSFSRLFGNKYYQPIKIVNLEDGNSDVESFDWMGRVAPEDVLWFTPKLFTV